MRCSSVWSPLFTLWQSTRAPTYSHEKRWPQPLYRGSTGWCEHFIVDCLVTHLLLPATLIFPSLITSPLKLLYTMHSHTRLRIIALLCEMPPWLTGWIPMFTAMLMLYYCYPCTFWSHTYFIYSFFFFVCHDIYARNDKSFFIPIQNCAFKKVFFFLIINLK